VGLRAAVEGLRAGEGRLLVTARDISERGAREAAEAARAAGVPHVVLGTRASLGGALGRDEVVAALVTSSDAARGLAAAVDKASGSPTGARER
jgi:ribosomal protein L7Ae-like RNA K-turn-binding protein